VLKDRFFNLCHKYRSDNNIVNPLYKDLLLNYTSKDRHYHNLEHIKSIFKALDGIELSDALEFAIFYHDIIYDVKSNKNEELSALFCKNALRKLDVPCGIIVKAIKIILDTKKHIPTINDSKYMIDADLFTFANDYSEYMTTADKIRKEYLIYSDKVYINSRIEFLKSLLNREKIYLTKEFKKYEKKARKNIYLEIQELEFKKNKTNL